MDDLAAKLKRRFDNWQTALNDSDQTVRQCQMKRAMFQADLEEAYRAGQLISLETHKALLAAANEAAADFVGNEAPSFPDEVAWCVEDLAQAIRAITHADAQAALDAMISRAREEELCAMQDAVQAIRKEAGRNADGVRFQALDDVRHMIRERFAHYARCHPSERFLLTPIGCGLAGYTREEIWPLVEAANMPGNVALAAEWEI